MNLKQLQLDAIAVPLSQHGFRMVESFLPDMWEIEGEYTTTLCYLSHPSLEETNTLNRHWVLGPCTESNASINEYHEIRFIVVTTLARIHETAEEAGLND